MTQYDANVWQDYAYVHSIVSAPVQIELYRAVAEAVYGCVVDFGCGTAKVAPFLVECSTVSRYTGIDQDKRMLLYAKRLLKKLPGLPFDLQCRKIEDCPDGQWDAGISVNTYYAWSDPERTLARIYQVLTPGAPFILASPNPEIDMERLIRHCAPALLMHPAYDRFKDQNRVLINNPDANLVDMETLIEQVCAAGFRVRQCHSHFYLGGMNYLELRKP